tara:strand:+ start:97 stop:489 length:393 start_codon:yes stop_codon:yes gene_type:complete
MIEEINGRWNCTECGYEWSAMLGDNEIPNTCSCIEEQDEEDCYDLTPKEMIATEVGLPMFDLEEAEHTHVHCSDDLTIECLVHSDGEIVDGMNLLVKVNQPSQNITDSYRLMVSVDYQDFTKEEQACEDD